MPNLISDFRTALVADLVTEFPTAEVLQGPRVGRSVDKPRITVFWAGSQEQSGLVAVGEATVIVRYWPASPKVADQSPSGVRDPGELEQAAWDLQAFLETKQTAYGATGTWVCRLTDVQPDYDPEEWGVEARIVLQFDNPATHAG
jgi:hypothetical protein